MFRSTVTVVVLTLVPLVMSACWADLGSDSVAPEPVETATAATFVAPPPVVRRLTVEQYQRTVHDIFGDDVLVADALEPDFESNGFISIGQGLSAISPRGTEQYESSAHDIAEQVLGDSSLRDELVTCEPAGSVDDACATEVLEALVLRAWRRPVSEEELARLVNLAAVGGDTLDDFDQGLAYAVAAVLISPNFLFRAELGERDSSAGGYRYNDYEMASRLSFFLWDTGPDDELLAAAERGELTDDDGLAAQTQRLLESPRARVGVRRFFTEMFELHRLDELSKDTNIFIHMSPEVGAAAREETLLGVEHLIEGDYRELLTTRRAFINRKLAAIYGVPAPSMEGFAETTLPEYGPRRGFLGQVSFLALHSHPVSTSATLRGLFVREVLLCQTIPPPPSGVDTSIPEPSPELPTLRDRIGAHLENPNCASCHTFTDFIGLGLENFDGLASYRAEESDVLIDASGDMDGMPFSGPSDLAELVSEHSDLTSCLVRSMYRYATGHVETEGEQGELHILDGQFAEAEYRVLELMSAIVMSPGFRRPGAVE